MAIVVLGLSVDLVKGQLLGDAPTTTKYGTFTGGFGLAVAILGLASAFIDAIPALVVMAADALSGLLLLGGGIAFAIGLRGVTCDATNDLEKLKAQYQNVLINAGAAKVTGERYMFTHRQMSTDRLLSNCKKATADQAMQFVTLGFVISTIVLLFLVWRNGRGSKGGAYV
ncbi:marvel domain-containing protein [Colletotrichum navitas]|uniref:Marvel domain-containing protein n=1 Tax=Colletotrichum navitas TaxID=681940 RepID=A0AAD8Q3P6_9PEZI|nr:marvel domain-containing protein [Colletotrichum navitas]KAK1595275.1 marvel domain-containing protein [Colletotrichum navitas]